MSRWARAASRAMGRARLASGAISESRRRRADAASRGIGGSRMKFAGCGHITLTVSKYDECLAFYDLLMTHIGMRRYFESPLAVGWFADEYMFVTGHAAPAGDRFSQWRSGLHHLSFRARSREEVDSCYAILKEIGPKIIFPPY